MKYKKTYCLQNIRSENRLNKCNTAQVSGTTGNATLLKLFSSQQNVKTQIEVPEMRTKSEQVKSM